MGAPGHPDCRKLERGWAVFAVLAVAAAGAAMAYLRHLENDRRRRRTRVVGVIPARFKSIRFPGKPLVLIAGKPMVVRTWEQARKCRKLDRLVVATDDEQIAEACRAAGAEVVMTSEDCANGTERCHEAVSKLPGAYDIVINIQGDEPLMEPHIIDDVIACLQANPDAVCSTACTPLALEDVESRSRVKCVVDQRGCALYFSRGPIPASKREYPVDFPPPYQHKHRHLLHLGLQCFDRGFLAQYCRMAPTPLMAMEDLEQLKILESGHRIQVIVVDHTAHGVDEPGDVAAIEAKMAALGLS